VKRAIRGVDGHHPLRGDDESGVRGAAELRVAFLVDNVFGQPDENVRLDFPDLVEAARSKSGGWGTGDRGQEKQ
jgi:hypothetical protein